MWLAISLPAAPLLDQEPPYVSTQDARLDRADQLEQERRFQEAIPIYETLLQDGAGRDPRWTAYVLFRLACAQYQSGDRMSALESAGGAATLDPAEPSYKAFQADLATERSGARHSSVYRARRDQGSARRLASSNGVLHIFARGRNTEPWNAEDEAKTRRRIEEADQWMAARATESGPDLQPVFEHRFLILADEPFWRRIDVPDADSSREYRKAWLQAILVRFQAASYAELFDQVFGERKPGNRSVVFHVAKKDISLSVLAPYRKEPTDLESVFVPSEASEWTPFYDAVAYAHEFLHLYGADDLFNKAKDPDAPEADVMNFGAHRLDDCLLSALTRYAIGWADRPPNLTRLRLEEPLNNLKRKKGAPG